MYDGGKIVAGLAAFAALALLPVWQSVAGPRVKRPDPKIVTLEKACVAPKETMRATHMTILDGWRDAFVRQGDRTFTAADGRVMEKSFSGSCLRCHPNKSDFCDSCHNDFAVKPYCWDCHIEPKEKV
jgi:hypothetical protein